MRSLTVYIDVLILLNLYINYILVRAAALFLRRSANRRRCVFAALLGAFGSLIILAPTLPFYVNIPYKILLCAGMVLIAFGKQKLRDFLVCALFFMLVGLLFGGILSGIEALFTPNGMILNNGVCFFNIPIAALASFTAGAYFLMKLVRRLSDAFLYGKDNAKRRFGHASRALRHGLRGEGRFSRKACYRLRLRENRSDYSR